MLNDTILLEVLRSHPGMSVDDTLAMTKALAEGSYKIQQSLLNSQQTPSSTATDSNAKTESKWTLSEMKVNPLWAIGEEKISCCICGEEFVMLTKVHLAEHNLTREEYKSLCNYSKETKLVSKQLAEKRRETTKKSKPWEQTERWKNKQKAAASSKTPENAGAEKTPATSTRSRSRSNKAVISAVSKA